MRGVLAFFNGQTQAEGYLSRVRGSDTDILIADFGGKIRLSTLRKNAVKVLAIYSAQPVLAGNP